MRGSPILATGLLSIYFVERYGLSGSTYSGPSWPLTLGNSFSKDPLAWKDESAGSCG